MFNYVVPVKRICVIMSCLEMDVGNSHEMAFSLTIQRESFKSLLRHPFY